MIRLALALALLAAPAFAQGNCHPDARTALANAEANTGQEPAGRGVTGQGVMLLTVAPDGRWTLHGLLPDGSICVLAVGTDWQAFPTGSPT